MNLVYRVRDNEIIGYFMDNVTGIPQPFVQGYLLRRYVIGLCPGSTSPDIQPFAIFPVRGPRRNIPLKAGDG